MDGKERQGAPAVPPGILSYLRSAYDPLAILAYGSYADGTWGPDSDFDALLLTGGGQAGHDVSFVEGVQLDVFLYPAGHFDGPFDPGQFPQLAEAVILLDRDGRGRALADRVRAWQAERRPPALEELQAQVAWCRKMLRRTERRDAEGLFRWHWLLVDSLEICCGLLGAPYRGPKKSLRWLSGAFPEGYRLYAAALARLDAAALEKWVAWLEEAAAKGER